MAKYQQLVNTEEDNYRLSSHFFQLCQRLTFFFPREKKMEMRQFTKTGKNDTPHKLKVKLIEKKNVK